LPGIQQVVGFQTGPDARPLEERENITGTVVSDTVSIGGLTAAHQSFLLCDSYAEGLNRMPMDGLLGLSPVDVSRLSTNTFNASTFFWQLATSRQVDPVFSLHLRTGSGDIGNGGELTLGGTDQSQYQGEISYIPLNATAVALGGEWFVDQAAMFVNGVAVKSDSTAGIALLDTGTAFIETPDNATAAAIYAQISPEIRQIDPLGAWGAPCDVLKKLEPQLTFTIGSGSGTVNVTVDRNSFNLGPYAGRDGTCQTVILNPAEPLTDLPVSLWTLGSPLLKSYYTIWDGGNQRVGFAELKNAPGGSKPGDGSGVGSNSDSGSGSRSGMGSRSGVLVAAGVAALGWFL
jgi:hypothetical protein